MKKLLSLALFVALFSVNGFGQVKVGYTNPEVIISQLPETVEIQRSINVLLAEKDSLLAVKAVALQKEFDQYDSEKAAMTQTQRQQKEQALMAKNDEFEEDRQKSLNEVQQKQQSLLRPLQAKVFAEIENVAKSLGLDLVLNQGSTSGGAIIFYADDSQIDITERVINNLIK